MGDGFAATRWPGFAPSRQGVSAIRRPSGAGTRAMNDSAHPPELRRPFMHPQTEAPMATHAKDIATVETSGDVQPISAGLLDVIARAARDPNVDIDKMERLIELQERVQDRNARAAYYAALAEMQPDLPVVSERGGIKDRQGNVQSTYALWEDVNEAIRPILAEHGFSLSFKVRRSDNEISVTGILAHREGHSEETELSLPTDTSGSKNAVQAVGSSTSYGKRYTAYALLNITTQGEDDDGLKGGLGGAINAEQVETLNGLADAVYADKRRFCRLLNVNSFAEIPASQYEHAVEQLRRKNAEQADAFLTGGK
jgi:hypothetical protein